MSKRPTALIPAKSRADTRSALAAAIFLPS